MRAIKVLLLSAFLCCCHSADDMLMLFERDGSVDASLLLTDDEGNSMIESYKYVPVKNDRKKILLKNSKIELEASIRHDAYVPRNIRKRAVLRKEKNRLFFNDINKMELVTHDAVAVLCFEINIYEQGELITSFKTNGRDFYDRKNKLMYYSNSDEGLLRKYWNILEENHCR